MTRLPLLLVALLAVTAAGCDAARDDAFVALPVVSGVLVADEPLPAIRLSRLAPLNAVYDPSAVAITDAADVVVTRLGADGAPAEVHTYRHDGAGRYVPLDASATAVPGATYRFRATVGAAEGPGTVELRAETLVPPAITIVEAPPDTVTYGVGQGPAVRLTTSSTAERRAVYLFTARATARDEFEEIRVGGARRWRQRLLPGRFGPVPTYVLFLGCTRESDAAPYVCDRNPADLDNGSSPLLNEDNYEVLPDGTARVAIPFIGIGFYGPQAITFHSLDDALVAFTATQQLQQNPTTISPGEIPNVTTNVENGLGVFGSLARATVTTFVRPATP